MLINNKYTFNSTKTIFSSALLLFTSTNTIPVKTLHITRYFSSSYLSSKRFKRTNGFSFLPQSKSYFSTGKNDNNSKNHHPIAKGLIPYSKHQKDYEHNMETIERLTMLNRKFKFKNDSPGDPILVYDLAIELHEKTQIQNTITKTKMEVATLGLVVASKVILAILSKKKNDTSNKRSQSTHNKDDNFIDEVYVFLVEAYYLQALLDFSKRTITKVHMINKYEINFEFFDGKQITCKLKDIEFIDIYEGSPIYEKNTTVIMVNIVDITGKRYNNVKIMLNHAITKIQDYDLLKWILYAADEMKLFLETKSDQKQEQQFTSEMKNREIQSYFQTYPYMIYSLKGHNHLIKARLMDVLKEFSWFALGFILLYLGLEYENSQFILCLGMLPICGYYGFKWYNLWKFKKQAISNMVLVDPFRVRLTMLCGTKITCNIKDFKFVSKEKMNFPAKPISFNKLPNEILTVNVKSISGKKYQNKQFLINQILTSIPNYNTFEALIQGKLDNIETINI